MIVTLNLKLEYKHIYIRQCFKCLLLQFAIINWKYTHFVIVKKTFLSDNETKMNTN